MACLSQSPLLNQFITDPFILSLLLPSVFARLQQTTYHSWVLHAQPGLSHLFLAVTNSSDCLCFCGPWEFGDILVRDLVDRSCGRPQGLFSSRLYGVRGCEKETFSFIQAYAGCFSASFKALSFRQQESHCTAQVQPFSGCSVIVRAKHLCYLFR